MECVAIRPLIIRQTTTKDKRITKRKMSTEEIDSHGQGDPCDEKSKMGTFEDLLELTGTRGPWNILLFCMCAMCQYKENMTNRMLTY